MLGLLWLGAIVALLAIILGQRIYADPNPHPPVLAAHLIASGLLIYAVILVVTLIDALLRVAAVASSA